MLAILSSIHKILMCVCVCLCVTEEGGSGVGLTIVMQDLCTYYYRRTLNSVKIERGTMGNCKGWSWNLPERLRLQSDTIQEQQVKRMRSEASSWSGCIRGRAAAEADSTGAEQQLKRIRPGPFSS